ncbi:MAG: hypothetical protein IJV65_02470 [Kiritimatiellae bacterium]|nr:hypothetical protein [Kiritimatiellia bacterium]
MKKTNLSALAAAAVALALGSGCASQGITSGADYARFPNTETERYILKYDVKPTQVSTSAQVTRALGLTFGAPSTVILNDRDAKSGILFTIFGKGMTDAKNAALNKALLENKCEAILGARYQIDKKDYVLFSTYDCKITGWPATAKSLDKVEKPESKANK